MPVRMAALASKISLISFSPRVMSRSMPASEAGTSTNSRSPSCTRTLVRHQTAAAAQAARRGAMHRWHPGRPSRTGRWPFPSDGGHLHVAAFYAHLLDGPANRPHAVPDVRTFEGRARGGRTAEQLAMPRSTTSVLVPISSPMKTPSARSSPVARIMAT